MPASNETDALAERVHDFIARALRDPASTLRSPAEVRAIVTAWRRLNVLVPGPARFSAAGLEALLSSLAAQPTRNTVFATRWLLAGPARVDDGPSPAAGRLAAAPSSSAAGSDYQKSTARYARMMEMMSSVLQQLHDTRKGVIQNLRA